MEGWRSVLESTASWKTSPLLRRDGTMGQRGIMRSWHNVIMRSWHDIGMGLFHGRRHQCLEETDSQHHPLS